MTRAVLSPILLAATLATTLAAAPAAADTCAALDTGIDREKLIFYVRDGLEADRVGRGWDDLGGRLSRAEDWLNGAAFRNEDLAEAVVNARRVSALVLEQLPELEARLAGMPDDGPEFPPVFHWPKGWKRMAMATNDSIEIQARYLAEDAEARGKEDWDEAGRIAAARDADLAVFQEIYNAFDREMLALVPESHPEYWLVRMRSHWEKMGPLRAERAAAEGGIQNREVSLKISRAYEEIAASMEGDLIAMGARLEGFGTLLAPYLMTLACDAAAAENALETYMASLERQAERSNEVVGILREYAEIEREAWRDGPDDALYERYDLAAFRYDAAYDKIAEEWSLRAKLLVDIIAAK